MPAVRPDTDVLFLHKNSAHMTDRSARGPTARGLLPLVFALVFWTGCADRDAAPKLSPPPLAANSKAILAAIAASPLAPSARVTNDRLRLASATDIPCEKTATASAAADTSRRSRYAQLEDAPNTPADAQNNPAPPSENTASSIATPSVVASSTAAASPAADSSHRSQFALLQDSLKTPDDARYRPIPPSAYQSPSTIASSSAPPSENPALSTTTSPIASSADTTSSPAPACEPAKVELQPDTTPKEFVLDATDVVANSQNLSSESAAPAAEPQPIAPQQPVAESQPIAKSQPIATQQPIAESLPIAPQQPVAQQQPAVEPQPVAEHQPVAPQQLASEPKPIPEHQLIAEPQPIAESRPIAEHQAIAPQQPVSEPKPLAEHQPIAPQQPVVQQQLIAKSEPAQAAPPSTTTAAAPAPTTTEPAAIPVASATLPWGPSNVSPEMAAISARAEEAARNGFNLAERGAMYSARAQFIDALRILTEAMDAQRGTTAHTRALNAGLRSLQEVNDFVPTTGTLETDLNFRMLVDSHHTPVLKDSSLEQITSLQAQRMYLSYAQEQLAAAGADQPVASLALHGLGKICTVPAEMHGPPEQIAEAKAVVYHQAALMVEPKNFMAANELGVLLAHFGRLPESRSTLEHAVAMSGGPTEWQNLAAVCDRLGDHAKAADARQQAVLATNRLQSSGYGTAGMKYPIQWLDPESFSSTNSMIADAAPPSATSSTSLVSVATKPSASNSPTPDATAPAIAAKPQPKSGFWSWLK
jgi:hypothetical protein